MSTAESAAPLIARECISVGCRVKDWREAIRSAGLALVSNGSASEKYIDEMIRAVDELGPYMVIAPGLALAHSRPSPSVKGEGLSLVTLAHPVDFGSRDNDPVSVVVALCATGHDAHLEAMSRLASVFSQERAIEDIANSETVDRVLAILEGNRS